MVGINYNYYVELKVFSLEEICEIVRQYNKFGEVSREGNHTHLMAFYRGQSDANWDIEPSIKRIEIDERRQYEKHQECLKGKNLFDQLAYLQHYSTGTRLIDFTMDYKVALYFACEKNYDKDGALFLYLCDPHKAEWIDTTIFTEIMLINCDTTLTIQKLSEHICMKYPSVMERFKNISKLNLFLMSYLDHGYMVLPSEECKFDNLRIKRQKGAFFICGLEFENDVTSQMRWESNAGRNILICHSVKIPESLKHKRPLVKLIIDSSIKRQILSELNNQGINKSELLG